MNSYIHGGYTHKFENQEGDVSLLGNSVARGSPQGVHMSLLLSTVTVKGPHRVYTRVAGPHRVYTRVSWLTVKFTHLLLSRVAVTGPHRGIPTGCTHVVSVTVNCNSQFHRSHQSFKRDNAVCCVLWHHNSHHRVHGREKTDCQPFPHTAKREVIVVVKNEHQERMQEKRREAEAMDWTGVTVQVIGQFTRKITRIASRRSQVRAPDLLHTFYDRTVERNIEMEERKNGLIITTAIYGKLSAENPGYGRL
ncbi:hypothetical protein DPMN_189863 [Dreissena polymorpha]|uniref:Uncharacterized protein n=1 Tax=Dreissena polymorpha TaxID=45954 RepID=A0A9D4DV34_DREPO|nr:hypothetical protein DPMN_189863 [Dreissena polymorpha]